LKGHQEQVLLHNDVSHSELCHHRLAHLKYIELPVLGKMVTGLPNMQVEHDGVFKGFTLGKNSKKSFANSDSISQGILEIIHAYVCR
jgi:hypothetical protein